MASRILAAAALGLLAAGLAPAARAETVALGSFAHADFERNDPDTSAALATAVQAGLDGKGRWKFVERSETDRIFEELGLSRRGFTSADTAARVGKLLKADLMLSGTIFTPKTGKAYIILECDELIRAEPVGQVSVELDNVLEKGHLTLPSPADLVRIIAAGTGLLESSAAKLTAQRDRIILKVLFLANHSNDPSLNGLERQVAAAIERASAAGTTHRLLRLDRPEIATQESELALLGLVEADSKAWAQVADYYLWGSYRMDHGAVVLTISLWDGRNAPQTLSEAAAPEELSALVDRLAQKIIASAVPVSRQPTDENGTDQRKKVADLLAKQVQDLFRAQQSTQQSPAALQATIDEQRRLMVAAIFFAPAEKANWIWLAGLRGEDGQRASQLPALLREVGNLEFGMEVAVRFLVSPEGKVDSGALHGASGGGLTKYSDPIYGVISGFEGFQEKLDDVYVGRNLLALQERVTAGYRKRLLDLGRRLSTATAGSDKDFRQAAEFVLTNALQLSFTKEERAFLIEAVWPKLKVGSIVQRAWYPSGDARRQLNVELRDYYFGQQQEAKAAALNVLSPAELELALATPPPEGCPAAEKLRMITWYQENIVRTKKLLAGQPGAQEPSLRKDVENTDRSIAELQAAFGPLRLRALAFLYTHSEAGGGPSETELLQGPVNPEMAAATDVQNPDAGGNRLFWCAREGDLPSLQALLTRGVPIAAAGKAFAAAVEEEQWPTVDFILEKGFDPAAPGLGVVEAHDDSFSPQFKDQAGRIALAKATVMGRKDLVGLLLKKGVQFDEHSRAGIFAVAELTKSHRAEPLRQMLAAHARANRHEGGRAPLGYAVDGHDLESLKLLLEAGADPTEYPGTGSSQHTGLNSSTQWARQDRTRQPKTTLDYCAQENWLEGAKAVLTLTKTDLREALTQYHPYHLATVPAVRAIFLHAELEAASGSLEADRAGIDLFTAIAAGDQAAFATALAVPGGMNFRGPAGETALMFACDEKAPGMARKLLETGAALEDFDTIGSTPLCYAARNGDIELVEAMVGKGADINLCRGNAARPLDQAMAPARNSAMSLKLLQLHASFAPHPRNPNLIPLFQATSFDLPDVARELIHLGADPHEVTPDSSIFFVAARSDDPGLIQYYVDLACDLNQRNKNGWTPLMTAVRWGAPASVQKLLELGLRDPSAAALAVSMVKDIDPPNRPPPEVLSRLHYRPDYRRCLEIMEEFGQISGSKNAQENIFWHERHTNAEIEAFLAAGGEVNYREGKSTPLQLALEQFDYDQALYLLGKGADPNLRGADPIGTSPLRMALPNPKVLEQFLKYGGNPNESTRYFIGDRSLLADACQNSSIPVESIRVLIRYGANPALDAQAILAEYGRKDDPRGLEQIKAALNGQ